MALTDAELEALFIAGEADRTERKRNADDLVRIRQAVCAFANDLPNHRQPGVVYVGFEDDGSCSNLPIDDDLLKRLATMRDDGSITPFPTIEVRRATIQGCEVAVAIAMVRRGRPATATERRSTI